MRSWDFCVYITSMGINVKNVSELFSTGQRFTVQWTVYIQYTDFSQQSKWVVLFSTRDEMLSGFAYSILCHLFIRVVLCRDTVPSEAVCPCKSRAFHGMLEWSSFICGKHYKHPNGETKQYCRMNEVWARVKSETCLLLSIFEMGKWQLHHWRWSRKKRRIAFNRGYCLFFFSLYFLLFILPRACVVIISLCVRQYACVCASSHSLLAPFFCLQKHTFVMLVQFERVLCVYKLCDRDAPFTYVLSVCRTFSVYNRTFKMRKYFVWNVNCVSYVVAGTILIH